MTAHDLMQQAKRIVCMADQTPFMVRTPSGDHYDRFCILHPLMTTDGVTLEASPTFFPNRGRIWWKLRDDIGEEEVVPGTVWTCPVELSMRASEHQFEDDKDLYQAVSKDVQSGLQGFAEVVRIDEDEPSVEFAHGRRSLPWPRPASMPVFLRGHRYALGPLKVYWNPEAAQLEFSTPTPADPIVLRIESGAFDSITQARRFMPVTRQYDVHGTPEQVPLELARFQKKESEQLRAAGEEIFVPTDAQVINWAIKLYGFTKATMAPLKDISAKVSADTSRPRDGRDIFYLKQLERILSDANRIGALGEDVARAIVTLEAFAPLVEKHVGALVAERVGTQVEQRRAEIDRKLEGSCEQLAALQDRLQGLQGEYEKRVAEQDAALGVRMGEKMAALAQQEVDLVARETAVQEQEAGVAERLKRITERYETEGSRIADELLAELPILRKMGLAPHGTADRPREAAPAQDWQAPAFLARAVPEEGPEEEEFVEQFSRVVATAGYAFDLEDLVNFHVCAKTGGVTVLAGRSGTGKSSLPRLYATALGQSDPFLHVPVRPDWLDDRDFLGAFNPLHRRYEPAASGICDRLIAAQLDQERGRGGVYLICLDEMNLARVEHYFAQFLSVLELPPEERRVALFAEGLSLPADPYHPYRSLNLSPGVRFVGTVNVDETTHFFSPKVLDRVNIIAFGMPDFAKAAGPQRGGTPPGVRPVHLRRWLAWASGGDTPESRQRLLLEVEEALRLSRQTLGLRRYRRVLSYVASAAPFFEEAKATDFALAQVVLPALRRTAFHFEDTLKALRALLPETRYPRTGRLLQDLAETGYEDEFFQLL